MKKVFPVVLRFFVIAFSVLYGYVSYRTHQWTITHYDISLEHWTRSIIIILIAFLLGLSVIKFPLYNKPAKVITAIFIVSGTAIGFYLRSYTGTPFQAVFVCSVYTTELIFR